MAAVIEQAIARWAKRRGSSASSTSSEESDSTHRRSHGAGRTHRRKRSRRDSIDVQRKETMLKQRRAKEQATRLMPQEFILFLPASLSPTPAPPVAASGSTMEQFQQQRLLRSNDLPLVLAQLESALKKRSKIKRLERKAKPKASVAPTNQAIPERSGENGGTGTPHAPSASSPERKSEFIQPFWLDISSPTMSDMRQLGKLLHLHPLTLEDIISQESREKLELFPRLGYYFIVFRALANSSVVDPPPPPPCTTNDKDAEKETPIEKIDITVNEDGRIKGEEEEGIMDGSMGYGAVQAVNVYLAVFRTGIISVRGVFCLYVCVG